MSAASLNQEAMKIFVRARDLVLAENKQAAEAVVNNNISTMEKLFKTGGIGQEAIDQLIFEVTSVKMMDLFLQNGGDMDKRGPPHYPHPTTLLLNCQDEHLGQRTPLYEAALNGNIEVCRYLLKMRAKVDGGEGDQPLLAAAQVY
jgi:hypothetical protein